MYFIFIIAVHFSYFLLEHNDKISDKDIVAFDIKLQIYNLLSLLQEISL